MPLGESGFLRPWDKDLFLQKKKKKSPLKTFSQSISIKTQTPPKNFKLPIKLQRNQILLKINSHMIIGKCNNKL